MMRRSAAGRNLAIISQAISIFAQTPAPDPSRIRRVFTDVDASSPRGVLRKAGGGAGGC